jgi:hypothetical protein
MSAPAMLRRIVPRGVRRAIGARRAENQAARVIDRLERLSRGSGAIVAGPWLGEVGFELLYWVPFLAWFAERFEVAPARLTVISRGGARAWYAGLVSEYHDVFDCMSPAEYRRRHDERVRDLGEQKQTRVTSFDRELVSAFGTGEHAWLHPSSMYELMFPYWWGHVGEEWVFRHARYRRLPAAPPIDGWPLPESYTAVKFYFNDCFPDTPRTRAFAEQVIRGLAAEGPVVSLTHGLAVDDHGGYETRGHGVITMPSDLPARDNLRLQDAVVSRARRFAGTYGGFSYLAPFHGVPTTAYYADARGFSMRHLTMARAALATLNGNNLLQVQGIPARS